MELRWAIMDRLCLFGRPKDEAEMRQIAEDSGIGLLIQLYDPNNPTEAGTDWSKVAKEFNIEVRRIENPDFKPPRIDASEIRALAAHALECFEADEPVGIHCGLGVGRTGTMAVLLVAELIRQSGSCSESKEQIGFVENYLEKDWGKC